MEELSVKDRFNKLVKDFLDNESLKKMAECQKFKTEGHTVVTSNISIPYNKTHFFDKDANIYESYLEKINLQSRPDKISSIEDIGKFVKNFCEQIFTHISIIHYPVDPEEGINLTTANDDSDSPVYRFNHEGFNHLRSLSFTLKFLEMLASSNKKFLNSVLTFFNFDQSVTFRMRIVLLALSSIFASVLRFSEGTFRYNVVEEENKIFPVELCKLLNIPTIGINSNIAKQQEYELSAVASGFLLKSMYENLGYSGEFVNILAFAHIYHTKDLKYTESITEIDQTSAFLFFHYVSRMGHYLDHCRGPYSDLIDENYIKSLFNMCNLAAPTDKTKLVKYVFDIFGKTIRSGIENTEYAVYEDGNMKDRCNKMNISISGLKSSEILLSNAKKFKKVYELTSIEQALNDMLNTLNQHICLASGKIYYKTGENISVDLSNLEKYNIYKNTGFDKWLEITKPDIKMMAHVYEVE